MNKAELMRHIDKIAYDGNISLNAIVGILYNMVSLFPEPAETQPLVVEVWPTEKWWCLVYPDGECETVRASGVKQALERAELAANYINKRGAIIAITGIDKESPNKSPESQE